MPLSYRVKIPHERVGVLIGPAGSVKRKIESACCVALKVDSSTGEIEVMSDTQLSDPTVILKAQNIITAIGRGFSPEKAMRLLDDDTLFDVIDLREVVGKSQQDINRVKGRLIGKQGKTRRIIEENTDVYISIYGYTIALIGRIKEFENAREAIKKLICGSQHKTVYRFLGMKRHEIKKERLKLWEEKEEGV